MGLSAMFALAATAQTTIKIKNPTSRGNKHETASKVASPSQIAGSVVCNTQYVASSTMDLQFTINLSNTDSEYGDLLTLNFPAGIVPNTVGTSTSVGTSAGGTETLTPISGQTVVWGDNDNSYGGIQTGTAINFTVNVTIGALTGNQNVTYDISGDTYGAAPGDLIGGSCVIYPAGATIIDVNTSLVGVLTGPSTVAGARNCAMGTATVASQIKNLGTNAESNISINYSVNGVASTPVVYPGPLAAGDSAVVAFPIPYNFAAQGIYTVKAWATQAGDVSNANDTASTSLVNSVPVALTSATYTNGFENVYDQSAFASLWTGLGTAFGLSGTAHTGTRALFYTIPAGTTTTLTTFETINIMPCTDVVAGETYRISFWKKSATSGTLTVNGQTGVFSGLAQDFASMTDILKPYSALTPTNSSGPLGWTKDSVDYVAATSETRYFAIGGKGTCSTTNQVNVRLDDIKIAKVLTTGIKSNSSVAETISIFPNPSTGLLNINTIDATTSVEVYNVIGEKVYSNKNLNKGTNSIDLSNLSNGSYFVKMNSNNNITTKKVVISK